MPASKKKSARSEWCIAVLDIEDARSSMPRVHPLVSVLSIVVLAVLVEQVIQTASEAGLRQARNF